VFERIGVFQKLQGVGDAAAHALADAGYGTIGDIIADSAEEVAQKAGISLGIARRIQIAADKYLQEDQKILPETDGELNCSMLISKKLFTTAIKH
jgi:N utilization substance protein A